MGRGNVCVFGKYEGLFYADRDYIDWYRANEAEDEEDGKFLGEMDCSDFNTHTYDILISEINYIDFIDDFIYFMREMFPSFSTKIDNKYNTIRYGVILENNLFEIEIEDNELSYAVKLIQKEHWCYNLEGLQARHYQNYLEGMKIALLKIFPEIGSYDGAWTSGRIKREDIGMA